MSEDPDPPLGERQEQLRDDVNAHTTETVGTAQAWTTTEVDRAAGAVNEHTDSVVGTATETLGAAVASRASTIEAANIQAAVDALQEQARTDHEAVVTQLGTLAEKVDANGQAIHEMRGQDEVDHAAVLKALAELTAKVDQLLDQGPKGEGTWRDAPDLIDPEFRPVLGIHTGGDGQIKSDPVLIASLMGHTIQAAPIYWKTPANPKDTCQRMLDAGTLPRLELCLPHIVTAMGDRMSGDFWRRVAAGAYDKLMTDLLDAVGELDVPILVSAGHESDLRSEDGASPKTADPPPANYCGDYGDFRGYWERFAEIARARAPKARLFVNWSGGFGGDVTSRWNAMRPAAGSFDFFGYDFYSQYGKAGSTDWDSFEDRLKMYGRWDWYKRNLPDVPLIVGETGVCDGPGGSKDAGKWVLDMIEFMVENRWQGVGTGGGISQIHYFSHHYAWCRCLDDTHDGGAGQKQAVLPQVGADERLAWA